MRSPVSRTVLTFPSVASILRHQRVEIWGQRMTDLNRRLFLSTAIATALCAKAGQAASVPAPPAGQGMIIVYRPRRAVGAVLLFSTTVNGTSSGNLTNGRILAHAVAPGNHTIETVSASVGGVATVSTSVKAGQTVFVRADARMGYPAGRPALALVTSEQGRSEVAAL